MKGIEKDSKSPITKIGGKQSRIQNKKKPLNTAIGTKD